MCYTACGLVDVSKIPCFHNSAAMSSLKLRTAIPKSTVICSSHAGYILVFSRAIPPITARAAMTAAVIFQGL